MLANLLNLSLNHEDKGFFTDTKLYTLSEMIKLIETAKLKFQSAYGSIELPPKEYRVTSNEMIVVGAKP